MIGGLLRRQLQKKSRTLPENLIFFVTNRCNQRCVTCFYWRQLEDKSKEELGLGDIRELAASIEDLTLLSLSGGEPFLRDDLAEICGEFIGNANPEYLFIPTNGMLPDRIAEATRDILRQHPKKLCVSVSVDGIGDDHDRIRGVPGSFQNAMQTAEALASLAKDRSDFTVQTCTTVHHQTAEHLPDTMAYLAKTGYFDFHSIEFLRGSPRDSGLRPPTAAQARNLLPVIRRYWRSYHATLPYTWLERHLLLGLKFAVLDEEIRRMEGRPPRWPCTAGTSTIVIYPEGDVALCEATEPLANLRAYDMRLSRLLDAPVVKNTISASRQCACTHGTFIHHAMLAHPSRYVHLLPYVSKTLR